jgi:hypothetical protein
MPNQSERWYVCNKTITISQVRNKQQKMITINTATKTNNNKTDCWKKCEVHERIDLNLFVIAAIAARCVVCNALRNIEIFAALSVTVML